MKTPSVSPATNHLWKALTLTVLPVALLADPYSLTWEVLAAGEGGGAAAGFSLPATLGAWDAGPGMRAGTFTLTSGFWAAGFAPVDTAPILSLNQDGSGFVLSWPVGATGFTLEQSPTLNPGGWTASTLPVVQSGQRYSVALPLASRTLFFRLVAP